MRPQLRLPWTRLHLAVWGFRTVPSIPWKHARGDSGTSSAEAVAVLPPVESAAHTHQG